MVIQYPHPLLRKRIEYDPSLDDEEVIQALFDAVDEERKKHQQEPLGLAANQIGIETRIVLYRDATDELQPLINPEIIHWWSDEYPWIEWEACGSLPGYQVQVARPYLIKVAVDKYSFPFEYFTGWESRIIQHEVDHLNGVLIMDREYDERSSL